MYVLPRLKGAKTFWAFDSEYVAAGLKIEDDVANFGFANNYGESKVMHTPQEVHDFIRDMRFQRLFVWSLQPEFGSLASWSLLGLREVYDPHTLMPVKFNPLRAVNLDSGHVQRFKLERADRKDPAKVHKCMVYDVQGFFKNMRWKGEKMVRLAVMAKYLADLYGDPSLYKPEMPMEWFGKRKPETSEEWALLDDRVRQDAYVTAKAVEYLESKLLKALIEEPSVTKYHSWGGVAREVFHFPKLHETIGRDVCIPYKDVLIHDQATFAGRSECFSIGQLPPCYYEDVASLYPIAVIATDALRLQKVVYMSEEDLAEPYKPYAWLNGVFESQNDLWGLPVRTIDRTYYVTGVVTGLFNTLDLEAAKAKTLKVTWGLKPIFNEARDMHEKYAELLSKKLEKRFSDNVEKDASKEVLNATSGNLGQAIPKPSIRSNFPAYNALVAEGHLIMSRLFDLSPKPHYIDTDSLFVEKKFEGKMFEVSDVEQKLTFPVVLEEKGYGEQPRVFRSKHYYLNEKSVGFHAIHIDYEDWLRIAQTLPDYEAVSSQIRGTFLTRSSRAKVLQIGRWYEDQLDLDLDRLEEMFNADNKRHRASYDSYSLCRAGRCIGSRAWTAKEFDLNIRKEALENELVLFPSGKHFDSRALHSWLLSTSRGKSDVREALERMLTPTDKDFVVAEEDEETE